jgi:hypothetical protein
VQKCSTSRWTASWKCIASYGRVRPACRCGTVIGQLLSFRNRRQSNAEIGGNLFGLETLNREAQERWDDDGGAIPLEPAIQNTDLEGLTTARTSVVGANDRLLLLNQLELANRYFAECEHRIARQLHLISKLRAKRQTTFLAVEFLRSLQASQVMYRAGRSRLQRALATLDSIAERSSRYVENGKNDNRRRARPP